MRIISGTMRGTKLYTLEGDNTRPTLDRVKEALFSKINFEIQDATILDLFAGSGALGLESLSRGAEKIYVSSSLCLPLPPVHSRTHSTLCRRQLRHRAQNTQARGDQRRYHALYHWPC